MPHATVREGGRWLEGRGRLEKSNRYSYWKWVQYYDIPKAFTSPSTESAAHMGDEVGEGWGLKYFYKY